MRVLGIDPGLRNLGWGVIDVAGARISHVANGQIKTDTKAPLPERLARRPSVKVLGAPVPEAQTQVGIPYQDGVLGLIQNGRLLAQAHRADFLFGDVDVHHHGTALSTRVQGRGDELEPPRRGG